MEEDPDNPRKLRAESIADNFIARPFDPDSVRFSPKKGAEIIMPKLKLKLEREAEVGEI